MTSKNIISLYQCKQSAAWVACYNGPHSLAIAELFGTTHLPTAFRLTAPKEAVLSAIKNLNPCVIVEIDE